MKMDAYALSNIILAHRRAMLVYRKDYVPLGRNAIEVMLYAYGKSSITATQVSRSLLHCNISQTKRIISILVSENILSTSGIGKKGMPTKYFLTEEGYELTSAYCRLLDEYFN